MHKKTPLLLAVLLLLASSADGADSFAVRVVQSAAAGRQVTVWHGAERGREIPHYGQTIDCGDSLKIRQELADLQGRAAFSPEDPVAPARAEAPAALQEASRKLAVLQQALAEISAGQVEPDGQCQGFAYKYGILDLTGSAAGFQLFIETPQGAFIGRLPRHPDEPATYTLLLREADHYQQGIGGVFGREQGYGLGDLRSREVAGPGFEQMHAGL